MSRAIAVTALIAFVPTAASADERLQDIFDGANEAWFAGDYEGAIAAYGRLVDAGVTDPDVEFNLATTYARRGSYGQAILHFERTLRLRGGDKAAARGLRAAHAALGRRRVDASGQAFVQGDPPLAEALVRPFSEGVLAWSLLLTTLLFCLLLTAFRSVKREPLQLSLGIAAPVVGFVALLSALGLGVRTGYFSDGDPGIVVLDNAPLREAPDPRARTTTQIPEGARVTVLEQAGDYARVRAGPGREGWMPNTHVEAIGR